MSTHGASLAEKHAHWFKSSISHGLQATELELLIPMVCLAATAVGGFSLLSWDPDD